MTYCKTVRFPFLLTGPSERKRAWNSGFVGSIGKRAWNSGFASVIGKRDHDYRGLKGLKLITLNLLTSFLSQMTTGHLKLLQILFSQIWGLP